MQCPKCACPDNKVVDSRVSKEGKAIRRRRECSVCAHRFTTYETIIPDEIVVIKRNNTREEFNPEKIRQGIRHACWKRPVHDDQIEKAVSDITSVIMKVGEREITSQAIGEIVMEQLQQIDEVAYVRFASVYRRFKDIDQFVNLVKKLATTEVKG
jgi:transcriptional repressor NrdR